MPRPAHPERHAHERGSQIVEFALLLPVLAFMTMMILDGGRLLTTYSALKNGVREASIYAVANGVTPSDGSATAKISSVIQTESNGFLQSGQVTSVVINDVSQSGWNQTLREVTVTYQFQFVNPVLTSPIFGASSNNRNFNISATGSWTVQ